MQAIALDASRAVAVFLDERLPSRFWAKCIPEPNSGCWIWTNAHTKDGYGAIADGYSTVYAHRFAYEALVGPLPPGRRGRRAPGDLETDHRCANRSCCNPSHLQLVSHRTNILRGESPAAKCARATTCASGHSLEDPSNVYVRRGGRKRDCRTCRRRWMKEHYERSRSATIP